MVTLVLDCCFLASVYCNSNSNIRYFLYNRIDALTYSSISKYNLVNKNTRSISCYALMRNN